MTKRVAIIPARGGSTRLVGKNVYPLAGKPLISWTIEAVLESRAFDRIYVSTDGADIAAVARRYPEVTLYDRPAEFATARVTVLEAIVNMMQDIPRHDVLAYFLPTCPFRNADDIRRGIAHFDDPAIDSVVSVCEYDHPVQLALRKLDDYVVPAFDNLTIGATNSKFMSKYYRPNGGFYMSRWDNLAEKRNFFVGRVKCVELPLDRSVDIDVLRDIKIAEAVWEDLEKAVK
jgi:CMP-N-acetylneuraminic acid synthetase